MADRSGLVALHGADRAAAAHLFAGYPCLSGCVDGVLTGGMGALHVASSDAPLAAVAEAAWRLLAGDAQSYDAGVILADIAPQQYVIPPDAAWQQRLQATYPGRLDPWAREAFEPSTLDRDVLRGLLPVAPPYEVRRVDADLAAAFAGLRWPLVDDFASLDDFVARGIGYAALTEGRMVAGASSVMMGVTRIELEAFTETEHRGQGLAQALLAAVVLEALERGLEPWADASHPAGAAINRKLGFRSRGAYTGWITS